MTDPALRPATPDEETDYFDGTQAFPGAVETEHGLLVKDVRYDHVSDAPDVASYVAHVNHLLGDDRDEIEHMLGTTTRNVVSVGWDGHSNPMLRYEDELHLPEHMRSVVSRDTRKGDHE